MWAFLCLSAPKSEDSCLDKNTITCSCYINSSNRLLSLTMPTAVAWHRNSHRSEKAEWEVDVAEVGKCWMLHILTWSMPYSTVSKRAQCRLDAVGASFAKIRCPDTCSKFLSAWIIDAQLVKMRRILPPTTIETSQIDAAVSLRLSVAVSLELEALHVLVRPIKGLSEKSLGTSAHATANNRPNCWVVAMFLVFTLRFFTQKARCFCMVKLLSMYKNLIFICSCLTVDFIYFHNCQFKMHILKLKMIKTRHAKILQLTRRRPALSCSTASSSSLIRI